MPFLSNSPYVRVLGFKRRGVNLLIDTDLSSDVEDAAALAVANYFMYGGEANIKAVVVCTTNNYSPGAADAINTYYGHADIPIGANKGAAFDPGGPGAYAQNLAQNFPNDTVTAANATEAVALYRQLLAAAGDASIVIVAIGPLRIMSELLNSPADGYSSLTGSQLIAAKVRELVVAGGDWPNSTSAEWNFAQDASAANNVVANWPTTIIFNGFSNGNTIYIGGGISNNTPVENPVRKAYELAGFATAGRQAWGALPLLYAVRGLAHGGTTYYTRVRGTGSVNASTGQNTWVNGANGPHYYLVKNLTWSYEYVDILNTMLFWEPGETFPPTAIQHVPSTVVEDTFTDSDGTSLDVHVIAPTNTPPTAWTEQAGDWSISGNAATVAASANAFNSATVDAGAADVLAEIVLTTPASGVVNVALVLNYQDSSNYWFVELYKDATYNQFQIYRRASGSDTLIASNNSAGIQYGITYTLRAVALDNCVEAILVENNLRLHTQPGSRYFKTMTKHGVRIYKKLPADGGSDTGTVINSIKIQALTLA